MFEVGGQNLEGKVENQKLSTQRRRERESCTERDDRNWIFEIGDLRARRIAKAQPHSGLVVLRNFDANGLRLQVKRSAIDKLAPKVKRSFGGQVYKLAGCKS